MQKFKDFWIAFIMNVQEFFIDVSIKILDICLKFLVRQKQVNYQYIVQSALFQQSLNYKSKKGGLFDDSDDEDEDEDDEEEEFAFVLPALLQQPTTIDEIIFYLEEYQEKRSKDAFIKIINCAKKTTLGAFLIILQSQGQALRMKLYEYILPVLNFPGHIKYEIKCLYKQCQYKIYGEGYVMQEIFHQKKEQEGKILPASIYKKLEHSKFCEICLEHKPQVYMSTLNACNHEFCSRCLVKYFEICIENHKFPIPCPQCSIPLSVKNVRRLLSTIQYCEKYLKLFFKQKDEYLVNQNKAIFCPNPHCKEIIRIDEIKKYENCKKFKFLIENQNQHQFQSKLWKKMHNLKNSKNLQNNQIDVVQIPTKSQSCLQKKLINKCLKCKTKICQKCRSIWHEGLTCIEFKQLQSENLNLNKEMFLLFDIAERLGYGQCPKCRQLIEKYDGCDHIRCICGGDFNIDRNAIQQGIYYQRPVWMYGNIYDNIQDINTANSNSNNNIILEGEKQIEGDEFQWLQVDFLQNYSEINDQEINDQQNSDSNNRW